MLSTLPALAVGPLLIALWICFRIFYNLFLHPLRSFPGPKIAAASQLWNSKHFIKGNLVHETAKLHERYGNVVRVAPNELSYTSARSWVDIHGLRNNPEFLKNPNSFPEGFDGAHSMLVAPTHEHRVMRRQLAHGFSEKALREQEHVVTQYLDLLMQRLRENCKDGGKSVDLMAWYNFFTFDVIGHLAYREPFDCLRTSSYHQWVRMIFENVKYGVYMRVLSHFPLLPSLVSYLAPAHLTRIRKNHEDLIIEKTQHRIASTIEQMDFLHNILKSENRLSDNDLYALGNLLIIGGSETTGTVLSGLTYYLLKNPRSLTTLVAEIRGTFSSEEEITMVPVSHLKYLGACVEEGLRIYPAAPGSNHRLVPGKGALVDGRWVPGGTIVGTAHYATYHSSRNFTLPDLFIPERWLGDKRFDNDQKSAFQPFSIGPRNCIGKNLAYSELRLVLTRLLWNFDLQLDAQSDGWEKQKTFILWSKIPLYVYLKPRF